MNETQRHKLVWGWLRLFFGFAQMSLVALSLGCLVEVGVRPVTLVFAGLATGTTLLSRLLYHGRGDPHVKK